MNEVGYVKEIKGDIAFIVFKRKSGCGDNCGHCSGNCSQDLSIVDVKNTLNVSVGDRVEVSLGEKSFYKMTILVYGFPLAMLIFGVFLGNNYFLKLGLKQYELYAVLLGILFLTASYSILGKIDKKLSQKSDYSISLVRIVDRQ